ncbi:MAG: conjugal transfer protein TraF [Campylobacterota bacterium]|nr:conjugal transfer protein TraF [Campylobacterota bacterium]
MNYKKLSLSMVAALSITSLNAYEMKSMGYKATGLGGAGVASSRGSLATYYNPALLGISDYTTEISLNVGAAVRENGLIEAVDDLNELGLTDSLDAIEDITSTNYESMTSSQKSAFDKVESAIDILNRIPNSNGVEVSPSVSLATQISRYFGIGVYSSAEIRVNMNFAQDDNGNKKLGLIFDTDAGYIEYTNGTIKESDQTSYDTLSLQGGIDNNLTTINVNTMITAEVPLSFAVPFEMRNGTLSFGITGKAMAVEIFSKNFAIDSDTEELTDDYEENKKTYSAVGVDLGVAYKEHKTGLTLGLVGKNINNPSFETEPDNSGNVETFELEPFFRAGLSLPVWNDNIEFAIDADLQQSDTSYEGMKSQYVGGGMEFHPASWFALRAGLMKNVATESINEGFIYTAGFGFGLKWLQLDASVQMSQETGTFEDEEIPKYVAANISFISRWGDGYNRKVPPAE